MAAGGWGPRPGSPSLVCPSSQKREVRLKGQSTGEMGREIKYRSYLGAATFRRSEEGMKLVRETEVQ